MRSLFMLVVLVLLQFAGITAKADSFDIDKNGNRYHCEQVSGGGGSCWDKCPYGFNSCATSCGGGQGCWNKCPYGFSSCATSCGGGKGCWDKCPYGFSSCATTCGPQGLTPATLTRVLNTNNDRVEFEKLNQSQE